MIALWVGLLGCAEELPPPPGSGGSVDIEGYHGLEADARWTWRAGGQEGSTAADDLILGRWDGEELGLRQGSPWAEGADWGGLVWDLSQGLSLTELRRGDEVWEGPWVLVGPESVWEEPYPGEGWSCTPQRPEQVVTWYAVFEEPLWLECEGDGPEGSWVFAEGFGLVLADTEALSLDLVAAW